MLQMKFLGSNSSFFFYFFSYIFLLCIFSSEMIIYKSKLLHCVNYLFLCLIILNILLMNVFHLKYSEFS